jgi:hypothetical protein
MRQHQMGRDSTTAQIFFGAARIFTLEAMPDRRRDSHLVAETSIFPSMLSAAFLSQKFAKPLPIKDGSTLRTIAEARAYMLDLPAWRTERRYWQHAAKLILESTDVAMIAAQLELALFLDYQLDLTATP